MGPDAFIDTSGFYAMMVRNDVHFKAAGFHPLLP
jgi:hypothetical protein